jgi:hypothetical protein
MKKIYVQEPKFATPTGTEDVTVCYMLLEWEQGLLAIEHLPCSSDACRVQLNWGDTAADLRQRVLDNILAHFTDVTSNDVIFLGGWV